MIKRETYDRLFIFYIASTYARFLNHFSSVCLNTLTSCFLPYQLCYTNLRKIVFSPKLSNKENELCNTFKFLKF